MRDKNQVFIFNDAELSLIKTVFGDNEALLYTVRKVLLQFPLTDAERNLIKLSITPEVWAVLKKRILPDIGEEFPLTQLADIRTTLTEQLKVKTAEEMRLLFAAKQLEIDYLEQQFAALKDIEAAQPSKEVVLKDMARITGDDRMDYINMHAYLFLLGYIDPMLNFIRAIAGEKKETLDEQKQRMERSSNK